MIILSVFLLDRLSKYLTLKYLGFGLVLHLIPGLNLQFALNHGVAFSLFYQTGTQSPWFLVTMTGLMSLVILYMLYRTPKTQVFQQVALSFILAGALSNIVDRVYYGAVIDFIDVYVSQYHWPIFNLADSFICIGAFLLLWKSNKDEKRTLPSKSSH